MTMGSDRFSVCSVCVLSCTRPQTATASAAAAAITSKDDVSDVLPALLGAGAGAGAGDVLLTVLGATAVAVGDAAEGAVAGTGALALGTVGGGGGKGTAATGAAAGAVGVTLMMRGKFTPGCGSRRCSHDRARPLRGCKSDCDTATEVVLRGITEALMINNMRKITKVAALQMSGIQQHLWRNWCSLSHRRLRACGGDWPQGRCSAKRLRRSRARRWPRRRHDQTLVVDVGCEQRYHTELGGTLGPRVRA